MKPGSFDIDTSKEIIGDADTREIEAAAKADFDVGIVNDPYTLFPRKEGDTMWDGCIQEFRCVIYRHAYETRRLKAQRTAVVFEDDPELVAILETLRESKAFIEYASGKEKAFGGIVGSVKKIDAKFDPKQIKQKVDKMNNNKA